MSNKKSRRYTEQADALRKKLGNREYILGLDLGVGSIGSAVVAIDNDGTKTYPSDIVYSGVRIFPSSKGAADRREHRSQRNSLRHRKNRLKWVWKTLAAKGLMLPFSSEDTSDPATLRFSEETRRHDPYSLRYKGLLNNTFISRKIDHSTTGELLKGTSYAFIASEGNDLVYWTKKKVISIDNPDKALTSYRLPKWIDNDIAGKQKLESFISHNARIHNLILQNKEKAESLIIEENRMARATGKKEKAVTEQSILKRALMLTGGKYYAIGNGSLSKMFATRQSSQGKPGNIYDSGKNYCIDLFHDEKGLLRGEVIRKIDVLNKGFVPHYKMEGYSPFFRLFTYDALEVDCTDKMVKTPNASSEGRTVVVPVTFTARPDGSIQLFFDSYAKERPEQNPSFRVPSTIKKAHTRTQLESSTQPSISRFWDSSNHTRTQLESSTADGPGRYCH